MASEPGVSTDSLPNPPSVSRTARLGRDVMASLVVFLVALPLCLGIAVACGAPPAAGLVAGIVGGLVVGTLSGVPLQVSGPAAGLVSLVHEVIQTHGMEALGVITLLAGLIQIAVGVGRFSGLFRAVSPALVQGMLSGIGVIIVAGQFHVMVDDTPSSNALQNLALIPQAIEKGLFPMDGTSHHMAAAIGLFTLLIILLWSATPRRFQMLPAALLAVAAAVFVAQGFQLPVSYVQIPAQVLTLPALPEASRLWALLGNADVWIMALSIGFIAAAETLLSVSALQRQDTRVTAAYDREVIAQGVGNSLCGLLGALPVTGVIVRSSANLQAGAQTRLSTVLHGLWLAALVLLFPVVLEKIPIASLAAVLVYTGFKLIRFQAIPELFRISKGELLVFLVTLIGVVSTNLLEGVLMGFALASLRLLYTLSKLRIDCVSEPDGLQTHVYLRGSASFLSLPTLSKHLEALPGDREIHLHVEGVHYIDHACLEALGAFQQRVESAGGRCLIEWAALSKKTRHRVKLPVAL